MYIDLEQLRAALAVRDLTDPTPGPHAMQALCDALVAALAAAWGASIRVVRGSPVVTARDNYDRLYYPADGVARDARYTRWIGPGVLLRSQTSAAIPPAPAAPGAPPTRSAGRPAGAPSCWCAGAWCIPATASIAITSGSRTRSICGGS